MTLWIDVEDLFVYARLAARPSGIQRLTYEIYAELVRVAGSRIRFVRHGGDRAAYVLAEWEEIAAMYERMAHDPQPPVAISSAPARPQDGVRGSLRRLARNLPVDLRVPAGDAVRSQLAAFRAIGRVLVALGRITRRAATAESQRTPSRAAESNVHTLAGVVEPGDILCVFGAPWVHADIEDRVARAKSEFGLKLALLVYDLIPVVRPEFVLPALTDRFGRCYRQLTALADHLFAISEATARDVEVWSSRSGIELPCSVLPIPIGTGFSPSSTLPKAAPSAAPLPAGLSDQSYVLFVSTIEARKNHDLAFRVWRNLLDQMTADQVPTLVFAGRVGWMAADLMQKISNSRNLDGKLMIVSDPSDKQLSRLYAGCRFTIFPSLYEGWGLPVTESLNFGKTCIVSNRTSLPEAGGDFCLYIDPDNITEATTVLRRAIEDEDLIPDLERKIARDFKCVPWERTARMLCERLQPGHTRPEQ